MASAMVPPWLEDLRLLFRLLQGEPAAIDRCLATRRSRPELLASFAASHGLSTVMLDALACHSRLDLLSPEGRTDLERRREARATRSAALLEELERLRVAFAVAGLPFLLLKGPYLAERLYGGPLAREYVDLDLMVRGQDRHRAFSLLHDAGYEARSGTLFSTAATCFFLHGFDFDRRGARVDLHWRLSRHPSFRIDEERLWATRRSGQGPGGRYEVLSDEYEIVFAALSLLRDIERGSGKLKNVIDLLQLLVAVDAGLDWAAFFGRRRSEGTLGPSRNILALCLALGDARDSLPRLAATLQASDRPVAPMIGSHPLRFSPLRWSLGNKVWSARVHDSSAVTWLCWWSLSLPFRVAAHAPPGQRLAQLFKGAPR